ncbi:MAG: cofactor-independent phosphoglycerate mutase [Butyricicoccus pullicaecorum]|nr:cofactor-independent phosphoglycerate mutase [Butyricicoccus pullicaecorum]
MKYAVVLGDGMADEPIGQLGGKTPLAYANTPMMDQLSETGEVGLAKTIPAGMKPGSDTANLAVLGYDPEKYYSGRSPLEALSIGVPMLPTDIALRCNTVTLSDEPGIPYAERTILDHSADEISTVDAAVLVETVREAFENGIYKFYTGTSYRHCLIWANGVVQDITPPHDILGKKIGDYLPEDPKLREMMEKSFDILDNHPLNAARAAAGKHKANSCWFWGAGTKPALSSFTEKTGKKGAMVSAVDLLKGIAVGAGMQVLHVEGATGGLTTNYEGKAAAAVQALLEDGNDFVYIHVEAPDEMGHQGSVENKVKSIEYLDSRVIRPLYKALAASGEDFRILVMPDHPTPIRLRTHTGDPVPYLLYDSTRAASTGVLYNEEAAKTTGVYIEHGYTLIDKLLEK